MPRQNTLLFRQQQQQTGVVLRPNVFALGERKLEQLSTRVAARLQYCCDLFDATEFY